MLFYHKFVWLGTFVFLDHLNLVIVFHPCTFFIIFLFTFFCPRYSFSPHSSCVSSLSITDIKHQLKDLSLLHLSISCIPSFPRPSSASEVFFFSLELSYPSLHHPLPPYTTPSHPFLPSWDLGQCRVYLRGKPRIFHKASISVFHKAASHEYAAGCQTRPHNSSKRPEEAGADGSVWWGGKISGCEWAKKGQKRVWKMTSLPFSAVKIGTNYHEIIKQFNTHGVISCMFVALVTLIFPSLHVQFLSLSIQTKEKVRKKRKVAPFSSHSCIWA